MLAPPYHFYFSTRADDDRLTVYGAPVLCAPMLAEVKLPPFQHAFAIYWDEDHDDRILNLADVLHHHNVLGDFLALYEHEGSLLVVLKAGIAPTRLVQTLAVLDGASSDVMSDVWPWHATTPGLNLRAPDGLAFGNGGVDNYLYGPIAESLKDDLRKHRLGSLIKTDQWGYPL